MKIFNYFLSLALIVCLLGCSTLQNSEISESRLRQISIVTELASYNGTFLYLASNPEKREIFVEVVKNLDILLKSEVSLNGFLEIVAKLPIKELQSNEGRVIVQNGILLFGVFQDDLIKLDQLEQVKKLKPVILALKHGIERGLAQ